MFAVRLLFYNEKRHYVEKRENDGGTRDFTGEHAAEHG